MADHRKKPAMSLNELHNRYLIDLSASQARPKQKPGASPDTHVFGDAPSFDFDSPTQGEANVKESVSKFSDSSPRLFSGIADFDSPSPSSADGSTLSTGKLDDAFDDVPQFGSRSPSLSTQGEVKMTYPAKLHDSNPRLFSGVADFDTQSSILASETSKSCKTTEEEDDDTYKKNPASSNSGEDKQVKVRIEGRRRLCKISKNNENNTGAGENIISAEESNIDDVSDFRSPLQVKNTCESSGNEIRDILNDLSSKLEFLSIEKKRPEKVDITDEFQASPESNVHGLTVKEGFQEHKARKSSHLPVTTKPKDGGNLTNKYQKKKAYGADVAVDSYLSKPHKNTYKYEILENNASARVPAKSGSAKQFQDHTYKRDDEDCGTDNSVALKNRNPVIKKFHQSDFIDVSDEEADEVTISDDHVDDFTLSGLKGTYKLPSKTAKMLYPHQREGLKWLWSLHCKGKGGILGDDMGLGKTMQICSFLCGLFHSNLIRRVLVVAPKTLLTHWSNELSKVGLSGKTREYFATCPKTRHYELQYVLQDKGILLTTYDIVRNNTKSLCGNYHYDDNADEDELTWDYMILDEGHLIKNPSTQRAKSLLQIPCRHRIIISGTPLQNNLKELWALFNFCCPELLGDKKEFKEKYEYYINRGIEKNASEREKRVGSSVAKNLRDCIQPYFLRRMKSEVFGDDSTLSKKSEIIVWLRLTQCQRRLYEAFLNSEIVVSACDGSPLAALTILKKVCDHPLLLTKRAAEDVLEGMDSVAEQEDHRVAEKLAMHIADVAERFDIVQNHDISCKISFILSLLGDLVPKGHNVLIFSQTRKMLNLIQESLISNHYKYLRIDGTTKINDRAKIVKDFQEGHGAPIFLLTSQVGGLGLTLTNADRVIVVDPAWNPSTDNQSVDRAYRIGQKKDVTVYRLMTCGTVEEKIYRKQVFKGGLFRSATEHKEQIRYFSQQDLKDLFSLPVHGFDISPTQQQLLEEHDRDHTMEESLKAHVEFLETLNIAGVSQHSLLFSKAAAPLEEVEILEEPGRLRGMTYTWHSSKGSSVEHFVNGSQYAFNPKDVQKAQKNTSPDVTEPSEAEIRARIGRLNQILNNTAAVSRLPDKGEKLHRQIDALTVQLDRVKMAAKGTKDNAIEL